MSNHTTTSIHLKFTNGLSTRRVLVLEPWTKVVLDPGHSVSVYAEGDPALPLEIELFDDRLIVYAFDSEGALLTVPHPPS